MEIAKRLCNHSNDRFQIIFARIRKNPPKIFDNDRIRRHSQADIFIDACTFSIVAAAREQTLILNSPRRRLRIDLFLCRLDLLPSTNLANVSLSGWEKTTLCSEKKAHQHWRQCVFFFCLWFNNLIEFFNNAHEKRREGSLLPLSSASLLDLQGINILQRIGCSPLRGRRRKKKHCQEAVVCKWMAGSPTAVKC